MIYIENTSTDPYFNLALEYYLISEKKPDDDLVFLFWRTEPTLMVGKYQNTLEEINEKYVREQNIRVVRRMSGGGTIYTDPGGWQYSFLARNGGGEICFFKFIEPVVRVIRDMGADAGMNGRNDLVVSGRKISGNAQYMHGGYTVHHGSLLYKTDLERLAKSTAADPHKIVSKGIKSVRDRVANIADFLEDPPSPEEFGRRMINSLTRGGVRAYALTAEDIEGTQRIADEKFRSWQAVYGASPKSNIFKTGRFEGGKVEAGLDIQKGRIADVRFSGDFFCAGDMDLLREALIGCEYDRDKVKAALSAVDMGKLFYKIGPEEILDLLV